MEDLSTNLEDYLESILNLIEKSGRAHISEIADAMGVSRPSVTQIIAKLAEMGFVEHEPYRDVTLTARGAAVARAVVRRHGLFREFLVDILGVPEMIADDEACKLEHSIGIITTEKFAAFIEYIASEEIPPEWLARFKKRRAGDS
jgi:DtxR family Mn-dependent transcriptional regulator